MSEKKYIITKPGFHKAVQTIYTDISKLNKATSYQIGQISSKVQNNTEALEATQKYYRQLATKVDSNSVALDIHANTLAKYTKYPMKVMNYEYVTLGAGTTVRFTSGDVDSAPLGLQFVFCKRNGENSYGNFHSFTVPKWAIMSQLGAGHEFWMNDGNGWAEKYVYIHSDRIVGYGGNTSEKNNVWCLRYLYLI